MDEFVVLMSSTLLRLKHDLCVSRIASLTVPSAILFCYLARTTNVEALGALRKHQVCCLSLSPDAVLIYSLSLGLSVECLRTLVIILTFCHVPSIWLTFLRCQVL